MGGRLRGFWARYRIGAVPLVALAVGVVVALGLGKIGGRSDRSATGPGSPPPPAPCFSPPLDRRDPPYAGPGPHPFEFLANSPHSDVALPLNLGPFPSGWEAHDSGRTGAQLVVCPTARRIAGAAPIAWCHYTDNPWSGHPTRVPVVPTWWRFQVFTASSGRFLGQFDLRSAAAWTPSACPDTVVHYAGTDPAVGQAVAVDAFTREMAPFVQRLARTASATPSRAGMTGSSE